MVTFLGKSATTSALVAIGVTCGAIVLAAPNQRAKPPKFPPETLEAFFTDARQHLVGERPPKYSPQPAAASAKANNGADAAAKPFRWSQLVSGDTLATEVKRVAARLGEPLANATRFKADGHVACQANFSQLAVLFAVIAEYDGDVRWRDDAPALRDNLARAAAICESGDDKSFAEAVERAADLEEIVRGGRLAGRTNRQLPPDGWSTLAERTQLMQRLQTAYRDNVRPQLSNKRQFGKSAVDIRHEAELMAALAELIRRPQYEYWDDDTFVESARELQDAATALSRAAADQDYEAARAATARAGQACTNCHEGYRL